MNPSLLEWVVTVAILGLVLLSDVAIIARRPHEPSMAECVTRLSFYLSLGALFGVWVGVRHGGRFGMQFFAGWVTEYSLSVDNLFVFVVIMTAFKVPRRFRQEALSVGIVLALVFRAIFILLGGVVVTRLSWAFYLMSAFLLYTAARLARGDEVAGGFLASADETGGSHDNAAVRFVRRRCNIGDTWHGLRLWVADEATGKRMLTPMFLVVLALATTDLMFAFDSIPAVYGLTRQPFLVLTVNILALMGLRQLYFILGHLLTRLIYLTRGLAVILAFIGIKMLLYALQHNDLPLVNGGRRFDVPEISTATSLVFLLVTLAITVAASLYRTRGTAGGSQPAARGKPGGRGQPIE